MARADLEDVRLMRLGLSSAAAPDAGAEDLLTACAARGLGVLELRAGDGHGIGPDDDGSAMDLLARAAGANVDIAGYRVGDSRDANALARLSRALRTAIIVADECAVTERIRRARRISDAGGRALVAASGDLSMSHAALAASGVDYAWEFDAVRDNISDTAETVLSGTGLRYIRLLGGGPEASLQEGRGIGMLMGRLVLAAYDGPVILAPGSTRYRVAWETWLGRRGGWGCGGRSSGPELVHLPVRTAT